VLVDVDERPELLRRVRSGTLHLIRCPGDLSNLGTVDVVVLFQRDAPVKIITAFFVYARPGERAR
jgi:hypothetical protein